MSDSYEHVVIEDQAQWRAWLGANHGTSPGIWLVTWKKASGVTMRNQECKRTDSAVRCEAAVQ
jgi:hypothetical protein